MTTQAPVKPSVPESRRILPSGGIRFDWTMAVLSTVLVGGLYLDLWAHAHGRTDNTFFTPWHAVLYSMLALVGAFLSATAWRAWRRGAPLRQSLPAGYGLSLVGVGLFALGGVADMVWHLLFGIEVSVDALLSPTHLVLAGSGVLIVTGSLRAAWHDPARRTRPWLARVPAALSLGIVLSIFSGMTQFVHPMVDPWAQTSPLTALAQTEIYVMDADGAHQTRLMISPVDSNTSPAYSADGTSIFFTRAHIGGRRVLGDLYRIANDGSAVTRLTHASQGYGAPVPSPDGRWIAVSFMRQDTQKWAIALLPSTGGDLRLLTEGQSNDFVDGWAPDGTRLVLHSDRAGGYQVYTMGADGSGLTRLTSGSTNWGGSFSPDGATIAFNSSRGGHLQIYTMASDGTDQRHLITSNSDDWLPSWSPDGRMLAFYTNRDKRAQLYIALADGTGQRNVLQTSGVTLSGWTASWSADSRLIVYAASANPPAGATPLVRQSLGAAGILVQAAILMGVLLLGLRGGTLPVGSLTLILGLNAVLVSVIEDQYRLIPGALVAGILGDLLLWRLRPSLVRPGSIRWFSVAVPVIVYACYFLSLQLTTGIGWSIHLWLGTTVVAGVIGLLLSYLVLPPRGATRFGPVPDL